MKGVLYIDHFEPIHIIESIRTVVEVVAVVPLNTWGKADYYWIDMQGNERMYERKQISEALSDLNAVEEQLGRHLRECDELGLVVEGVAVPLASGVQIYRVDNNLTTFRRGYEHKNQASLWDRWEAFKWSLWHECGVYVAEVSTWLGTARHIVKAFQQSYKTEHTTLQRYVTPHIPPYDLNPHIDNLCRIKGHKEGRNWGIGEKGAKILIDEFETYYNVITAKYSDLVGLMGGTWTRSFFEAIGRG